MYIIMVSLGGGGGGCFSADIQKPVQSNFTKSKLCFFILFKELGTYLAHHPEAKTVNYKELRRGVGVTLKTLSP